MATSFPGAVDSFPRPQSDTNTDDAGFELDIVIDHLSDAVEALETRVGFQPQNAQTGTTYTFVAADTLKMVTFTNAGAINVTVPPSVFVAGQRIDCAQRGAGPVTLIAGSGVTLNPPPGHTLVAEGQYAYFSLYFYSSTVADVVGMMAAV